jgi:hypothetical protein
VLPVQAKAALMNEVTATDAQQNRNDCVPVAMLALHIAKNSCQLLQELLPTLHPAVRSPNI